ncbi:MAG: nickel-type superoxide dismutase maturation protease [Planctomycetota bacterium]|nr:MAG: nickel-type superoxide dismutase maturation protease [Planctomycetota bacterium]
MRPTLRPGEEVLVDPRAYRRRAPRAGELVLVGHPYRRDLLLVKRVAWVDATGRVFVVGDDPLESTDSRSFGPLGRELLRGRVTSRLPLCL